MKILNSNMSLLRTIIVDDEVHIRDTLKKLIGQFCPNVLIIGEADCVESGIEIIRQNSPDLVLLDVQLKDRTSFDILRAFEHITFKIIFITAYEQYALQAFRFSAIDYLLKPVIIAELKDAIQKAEQMLFSNFSLQMKALEENLKSVVGQKHRIILKSSESIHLVDQDEIIFCQSDDCYTWIYTLKGDRILVSKTLKDYEDMLIDCGFYRVHKSYLVNLVHVVRFDKQDGGYVVLSNEHKVPVASRKKEELMAVFEKMAK